MWKIATFVVTILLAVVTVLFVRSQLELQKLNAEYLNCWAVSWKASSEWAVKLGEQTKRMRACQEELDRVYMNLRSSAITQDFQHLP